MRFLHLGDLHLGKTLGEFRLIDDQRYILDQVMDLAMERKADTVLVAGDVYDRAVPSEEAVSLLDYFICRMAEIGIPLYMVSGNHDSDERLHFGSSLLSARGVNIAARYEGRVIRHVLTDEWGEVCIYLLPFVKASQVRGYFPDEEIPNYDAAVRAVIAHAGVDTGKRNIIVAHQFVAGSGGDPLAAGSEGMSVANVGQVERVSSSCFDDFDYAALGHIHSPQRVGREEVRYSGSPLKYSLSEEGNEKSVPVVTLREKGNVEIELVPLRPMRELRHIKGRLRQLLSSENVVSPDDFIYATLTDEEMETDVMGIFQQTYPNTVRIDYDNSRTRALGEELRPMAGEAKPFETLMAEFYEMVYGCEITGEEMDVLRDAARKAGVLHEAD